LAFDLLHSSSSPVPHFLTVPHAVIPDIYPSVIPEAPTLFKIIAIPDGKSFGFLNFGRRKRCLNRTTRYHHEKISIFSDHRNVFIGM
jgi:hypothetical protein